MYHTVTVWDKPCEVTTAQKSKTVWVAVGTYMGEWVEVRARTESQAVSKWSEAARYKGNL